MRLPKQRLSHVKLVGTVPRTGRSRSDPAPSAEPVGLSSPAPTAVPVGTMPGTDRKTGMAGSASAETTPRQDRLLRAPSQKPVGATRPAPTVKPARRGARPPEHRLGKTGQLGHRPRKTGRRYAPGTARTTGKRGERPHEHRLGKAGSFGHRPKKTGMTRGGDPRKTLARLFSKRGALNRIKKGF